MQSLCLGLRAFCRAWFRWECVPGSWEAGAALHGMNLRADVCELVSKALRPSERDGPTVPMSNRSFEA